MATANKLTYLNETKNQLRTNINALGGDLTEEDTFRSYATELDNLWEELPHTTDTGTDLSLNTKAGKMKLSLYGNTSQYTTTGKNLLDTSLLPITKNGITISKNDNGDIVVNGTITGIESGFVSFYIGNVFNVEAGTYTSSLANKRVGIGLNTAGFGGYLNITMSDTIKTKTATATETQTINPQVNIRYDAGTFNNFILNPMLEKSSTATDYEPYTGGIASPNPSYPQQVHIVTGDNTIVSTGKNLLDISKIVNGYWYLDGVLTSNNNWSYVNQQIPVKPNTTYTLSRNSSSTTASQFSIEEFDSNGNFVKHNAMWQNTGIHTYTITMQPTTAYVYCQWNNTYTYNDIMFEVGSSRTSPYEAYIGTSYPINLPDGMFLGEISTYKDSFFKAVTGNSIYDNLDSATKESLTYGEWYLEKKIGKIESYNGETITTDFISTTGQKTTGATIYYGLSSPTYTPITGTYDTLASQLETAWRANSYKGQTNISQTNNDVGFKITATALRDMQNIFNEEE